MQKPFTPVFVRSGNNYDMGLVSTETGLSCKDPSLTQQQFKHETDINTIVDQFMKTGVMPDNVTMPQYGDYEGVYDFKTAMNVVRAADENFMTMPAKIRARFHNSPQEFLEFFANPENQQEAIRLGLAMPTPSEPAKAAPEPVKPASGTPDAGTPSKA